MGSILVLGPEGREEKESGKMKLRRALANDNAGVLNSIVMKLIS